VGDTIEGHSAFKDSLCGRRHRRTLLHPPKHWKNTVFRCVSRLPYLCSQLDLLSSAFHLSAATSFANSQKIIRVLSHDVARGHLGAKLDFNWQLSCRIASFIKLSTPMI